MERNDINQESKEEFSSAVNKQKGRVANKLIQNTSFISAEQKRSWNKDGYILLKGFCSEKFCDDLKKVKLSDTMNKIIFLKLLVFLF